MNKKFLSAILFGALMVTSTGTFVSCKDYDDDIDAINKELTDIKSQIAALQSKVDAGIYVTNITEAKDGINVAFSNGSTSYVKTATVVETEECYESAATIVNGEWVINKADGTVVATGVPASGVLVAGSQAAGYKLTVVNAAGEITEITLPTAASTLTSLTIEEGLTFGGSRTGKDLVTSTFDADGTIKVSGEDIQWGYCGGDANWKGPKGAIANGQLLVGDIASAQVAITPSTADLSAATLTLVNSLGEVAPVTIVATPNATKAANLITGSRATSTDGKWNLKLYLTNDVTKNNAASAFMKNGKHVLYALCVNGVPYTAYDIAVKMISYPNAYDYKPTRFYFQGNNNSEAVQGTSASTETTSQTPIALNAKLGTSTIDVTRDHLIYDSYIALADKDQAERYGVTVDGMKITAPNTAAEKTVDIVIYIKTVKGATVSQKATVTFGTITTSEGTIEAQSFKLMPNNMNAVFSVGDLFSSLTAEEADKVANNIQQNVVWTTSDYGFYAANITSNIKYYTAATCKDSEQVTLTASTIRTIKYIKIADAARNSGNATLSDVLHVVLKDNATNEIKKAKISVSFTLPTFEELFTKSGAWDGSTLSLKLSNEKQANIMTAYGSYATGINLANLNVPVVTNANGAAYFSYASNVMTITSAAVNNKGEAIQFNIQPTYTLIAGNAYTKITAADVATVNLLSPIHGMAATFVKAGTTATPEIIGTSGLIAKYNAATKAEEQAGLYVTVNGAKIAVASGAILWDGTTDIALANTHFSFDGKAGKDAKAELTAEGLKLSGLAAGAYETVVTISVVDNNGIKTVTTFTVSVKQ